MRLSDDLVDLFESIDEELRLQTLIEIATLSAVLIQSQGSINADDYRKILALAANEAEKMREKK